MKQKITLYVLLLLVCRAVAAEPINKPDNTTAAHPSISPKNVETIPTGPANVLFGSVPGPAPLAARAIGSYARGCLAGGVSLPINGPDWQVMRLSRDRNWGHPRLLDFLERFANDARHLDHWPGLLVGDVSQPRGGPMVRSHEPSDRA
jgi:penicillin-insensitive murein endopeptidase